MSAGAEQTIAGWVERVAVIEADLVFDAKLDTGADNSSLNAQDLVYEKRGEAAWIRFVVRDDAGKSISMALPMERQAKIKRHAGGAQRRPVVKLTLCLGGHRRKVDVNLMDRTNLDYQLLVGRSFLRSRILVDADRRHVINPDCLASTVSDRVSDR